MDVQKNNLTNEKLSKKFKSQFDLVNYAIKLAEDLIVSGRKPLDNEEEENPAFQALGEISSGKDLLDRIDMQPDEASEFLIETNVSISYNNLKAAAVEDNLTVPKSKKERLASLD